jgi:hypothetical protein
VASLPLRVMLVPLRSDRSRYNPCRGKPLPTARTSCVNRPPAGPRRLSGTSESRAPACARFVYRFDTNRAKGQRTRRVNGSWPTTVPAMMRLLAPRVTRPPVGKLVMRVFVQAELHNGPGRGHPRRLPRGPTGDCYITRSGNQSAIQPRQ